jgi:hypothetical protein
MKKNKVGLQIQRKKSYELTSWRPDFEEKDMKNGEMGRSELGFFDQLVVEGDQNSVVLISLHPQDRGNDILIHKI